MSFRFSLQNLISDSVIYFCETLRFPKKLVSHCACIELARFDRRAHSKTGWGMFSVSNYKRKLVWERVLFFGENERMDGVGN